MAEQRATLVALREMAEDAKKRFATKAEHNALKTQVENLVTAGGEPNKLEGVKVNGAALTIAEKIVDILIASGTSNGSIAVNGVDVMVKGLAALAFKANVSESDLDTALKAVIDAKAASADLEALSGKVTTLIGSDANKSARTIANEELAKQLIPENAKESLDTLSEIAAWIQEHPDDASALNIAISNLQTLVGTLPEGTTSTTVVDYITEAINKAAYKHPTHTAHASGLYKVTVDGNGHVTAAEAVTKEDITALGIPAQDTTYEATTAEEVREMLAEVYGETTA